MKYNEVESSTIELKREIPKNEQIIKTTIGFCNQNGGKLIIGVNNDGTIIGINENEIQKALEYLEKSIYESTAPSIIPLIYTQQIAGKLLLIIEVSSGMNKPYYLRSEGLEKGVYIRLGRSTVRANADMIEELKWQSRGREFDEMAVYNATVNDLDQDKIADFLSKRIRKRKSEISLKDALSSYHLIIKEHAHTYPTTAGILLFGKEPQHFYEYAMIICTHFRGISGREAIATKDCLGGLVEQYHEAYDFILNRLNRSFTIKGKIRKETLEIPEIAIREILINALVHRNYHIRSPIKIAIYENRIEVFSPGNFPGPLNQDNLRMGFTFLRNVAICKVFRELGIIEMMGTGFITVFDSYEKRGLKTPQIIEEENYVKCILPRAPRHPVRMKRVNVAEHELQAIIDLFDVAESITISDIISAFKLSRATAGRRITELVQKGLLEKIGKGKGARYIKRV